DAFAAVGAVEQQTHPPIRPLKLLYEIAAPGQRMLVIECCARGAMVTDVVERIRIITAAGPGGTEADRPPRQRILEIDREHGRCDRQRDERLKAEPTAGGSPQRLDSATRKGERDAHRRRTTQ